jgi:hypothetical protein
MPTCTSRNTRLFVRLEGVRAFDKKTLTPVEENEAGLRVVFVETIEASRVARRGHASGGGTSHNMDGIGPERRQILNARFAGSRDALDWVIEAMLPGGLRRIDEDRPRFWRYRSIQASDRSDALRARAGAQERPLRRAGHFDWTATSWAFR